MWTRLLLLSLVATGVNAQQESPMDLLRRVQKKVGESLDRVPKYMCTETIDRSQFVPDIAMRSKCDNGEKHRTHLTTSDRLRLDVAMAPTVEMYSWVGESRFNDRDLFDIVREGAISSGAFASFLTAIFRAEDASFTFNGDSGGKSEFGFQVSYERSHYYYGEGAHRVITAYDGTFTVDSKSADLLHLEVRTSELPLETAACHATTALDYSQVRINGADFLLPAASVLNIERVDGGRAENRTVFSNCHEFLGESTISFAPPASGRDAPISKPSMSIPAGLPFQIALTQRIDATKAAAGDAVNAKLVTPIEDGKMVVVPSNASVSARIVRLRRFYGEAAALSLELKLESVMVDGVAMPLVARPDAGAAFQKTAAGLQKRIALGTLRGLEERSASFTFRGANQRYIASGLQSSWVTSK